MPGSGPHTAGIPQKIPLSRCRRLVTAGARACPVMVWSWVVEYVDMHDRHDLTDEQWALLEPHLPRPKPGHAGRHWAPHRRVIDGVLWRVRTGCPWRDVPACYGPWKTVYNRHRRWSGDGTWDLLLRELQRGSDAQTGSKPGAWDVGIDSTVIRAHQHAAGAPRTAPVDVDGRPARRVG